MMVLSQQVIKEQEQKEEVNGKTDGKKVPILTISLRPGKELKYCDCIYVYCRQVSPKHFSCFCYSSSAGESELCSAKARILIIKWQGKPTKM